MIKEILRELCALPGVSGNEGAVRDYIAARVQPHAAEMTTDAMGNLLVFVKGDSLQDVAQFVAQDLSTIDGVLSTATHFMLKTYKAGGVFTGAPDDERLAVTP